MVAVSATSCLKEALVEKSCKLSLAALTDHGLDDMTYVLSGKRQPTIMQRTMLIARLHELLSREDGVVVVEDAVAKGKLKQLLGRDFGWVCPLLEVAI